MKTKIAVLLFLATSTANAGTLKVIAKKKLVIINKAKDVILGDQVCFYADDVTIACGKVIKLKGKRAYVRIKNAQGFGKFSAETSYKVVTQRMSKMNWLKIHLLFLPSYRFTTSEFEEQMDKNKKDGFDVKVGKFSFVGGGLGLEANVSDRMSVAAGGRYLYLHSILSYDKEYKHAKTEIGSDGSDIGFWLDSLFTIGAYKLGAGVDFALYKTVSKVASSAQAADTDKLESREKEVELTWHTLSPRLAAYRYFQLDKFGFRVGAVARYPVYDSDIKTHTVRLLENGEEQPLEEQPLEEDNDDDTWPLFAATIMLSLSVYLGL